MRQGTVRLAHLRLEKITTRGHGGPRSNGLKPPCHHTPRDVVLIKDPASLKVVAGLKLTHNTPIAIQMQRQWVEGAGWGQKTNRSILPKGFLNGL